MKSVFFAASIALSLLAAPVFASEVVSSAQAGNHIGKRVTVCGKAVEIVNINGDTFINLDKKHPYKDFYFYYYGNDFPKSLFLNKEVCSTGVVHEHKGRSQIIINNPSQISYRN